MVKTKTSKKHRTSLENLAKVDLDQIKGLRQAHPLSDLTDKSKIAMAAIFECLQNNDPEGAMEMVEIYLDAVNKPKMRRKTNLPKSTMYSALRHRNPTMKTLAKIMYSSTHDK